MKKIETSTTQQGNTYISGGQSNGKTDLMIDMMLEKLNKKEGFICIDIDGEISDYFLQYVAENSKQNKSLVDDIAYIDFGNKEYIPTLNIFDINNLEDSIQHILDLFVDIYGKKTFNLNIKEYMYNSLMSLAEKPETLNLMNVLKIFQGKKTISNIQNGLILDWFDHIKGYENTYVLETLQTIISPLIQGQLGRILNGSSENSDKKYSIDFKDMIKNNKIIILRLHENNLGSNSMVLLYKLLLGHIHYILGNDKSLNGDKEYSLFLPEGQYCVSSTLLKLLALSNKTNLQIIFGHNNIQQLDNKELGSSVEILENLVNYFNTHILFRQNFVNEKVYLNNIYGKNLYLSLSGDDKLTNIDDMEYISYNCKTNNSQKSYIEKNKNTISDKNRDKIKIVKDINKLNFGIKRKLVDKYLEFVSSSVL